MSEKVAEITGVMHRMHKSPEGELEYFIGSVSSDTLKGLTFVPVIETSKKSYLNEDAVEGYQRAGSTTRMNQFAEYLRENPLAVIPPVVVSGRGNWKFEGKDFGTVRINGPAAVIDGQHRLGGYVRLFEKDGQTRMVDFILLPSLSLDQEKRVFLTINNNQVGVPKALTAYLEGSDDALAAWELNLREDSPLKGKIYRQKREKGNLFALHSVAKNIGRTFSHGAFDSVAVEEKADILVQYWTKIADALPTEWADIERETAEYKLLELTGFIAWSWVAGDILGPEFDPDTKTVNWDGVAEKIDKLSSEGCIDWRKGGEFYGLTGEVGGKLIHRKMQKCLSMGEDKPEVDTNVE